MNRAAAATLTAATLTLAGACSSASHTTTPTASSTPAPASSAPAAQLSENSTCGDYLHASDQEQTRFLTDEVTRHTPQTNPSITIPAFPGGTPSVGNGNTFHNTGIVVFLKGALPVACAKSPNAHMGDVLAPAWSNSPSPSS